MVWATNYIIIDETQSESISEDKKAKATAELCRRRFSVGADGVILFIHLRERVIYVSVYLMLMEAKLRCVVMASAVFLNLYMTTG